MIKQHGKDKRTHPFVGILLLLIAIVLFTITAPLGFIFGVLYNARSFTRIDEYCLKIAIAVDQLGNVLMQHLLNTILIRKGGYKFGNRDETISSVLGKNRRLKTLSFPGRLIDYLLDLIESKHSLNAIDYYIEPETDIVK